MTKEQLERRVLFLTRYVIALTLVLIVVVLGAAGPVATSWFERINARILEADTLRADIIVTERLNVVEPDGRLALLAANSEQMPGVILNGDTVTTRGRSSGLIFFHEGHEVGGLAYRIDENQDPPYALGHFAFDQYQQDQVVLMQYDGSGARHRAGFYVNDRPTDYSLYDYKAFLDSTAALPEAERDAARAQFQERVEGGDFGGRRVALESDRRLASLRLSDYGGRERLRAVVDSAGRARIEFLDEEGNVVRVIGAQD